MRTGIWNREDYDSQLGKIERTELFSEDHGLFSFFLHFDFGGSGQGFGGYMLGQWRDTPVREMDERTMAFQASSINVLKDIMRAIGVDKWESLKGKAVWVYREKGEHWMGKILGIEAPEFVKHDGAFFIGDEYEELEKKYPLEK